jgi:hypothetical protein
MGNRRRNVIVVCPERARSYKSVSAHQPSVRLLAFTLLTPIVALLSVLFLPAGWEPFAVEFSHESGER